MNAIYGYLTGSDRQWAIIESVMDSKLARLDFEFEQVMMRHRRNLANIELKVLMESGSDEDLEMLYEAEAEETKEKGKGILSRIIDAIVSFFKKIRDFIFKAEDTNPPEQVEVENPNILIRKGNELLAGIRSFFSGKKGALHAAEIGTATVGSIVITKEKILPTIKKVEEFIKDSEEEARRIQTQLNGGTPPDPQDQEELKGAFGKLRSLGSRLMKIVKTMNSNEYKNHVDGEKADAAHASSEEHSGNITKLQERNDQITQELNQLRSERRSLEGKLKGGFLSFFTKRGQDQHKLKTLQKKMDSGAILSEEDFTLYNSLLTDLRSQDAELSAKLKSCMDKIKKLSKEFTSNESQIGKHDKNRTKDTDKEAKIRARMAGRT